MPKQNFLLKQSRGFASLPSHKVLAMPNLSPTMTKGTITKWYKKEGDSFSAGDVICDVETDKATVGFEMVDVGFLAKIIVPTGTKDVALGMPVAVIVDDAKDVAAFKDYTPAPQQAKKEAPKKAEIKKPEPVKEAPKAETKKETCKLKEEAKPVTKKEEKLPSQEQYRASPAARKIAADHNIDLGKIRGSGKHGLVSKGDVLEYLAGGARAEEPIKGAPPTIPGMPTYEDARISEAKAAMAQRFTDAKKTVPHFYVSIDCEVDNLLKMREFLNKYSKSKISINDLLIKIAAITCTKVKDANASWIQTAIRKYKDVDMTVSIQTPKGLVTPTVQRANLKGLQAIATETKNLKNKAKTEGIIGNDNLGGTFTISNAGMLGISQLIEIVNAPQACALGVGRIERKFEVGDEKSKKQWKIVNKMTVTLSCDHRVVDGAVASEWTKEFKKIVENPNLMLL